MEREDRQGMAAQRRESAAIQPKKLSLGKESGRTCLALLVGLEHLERCSMSSSFHATHKSTRIGPLKHVTDWHLGLGLGLN